jgi:signal transduction histidine kinase
VETGADDVTTFVCDSGPGLPLEERDRVFERFYRVSPGPIQRGGSLGLGLYISRAVVEAHGGRIWVADDDHSSFAFTVARRPAEGNSGETPSDATR